MVVPKASAAKAVELIKEGRAEILQGGILDGPLAFDNTIIKQAAQTKGIKSGDPDILLAQDLEAATSSPSSTAFWQMPTVQEWFWERKCR